MNIAALGLATAAAATPLAQTRGSEVERVRHDTAVQQREAAATMQAESAEGIGVTSEEQGTSDRDADGRRPWELPVREQEGSDPEAQAQAPHLVKDPTGKSGSQLDLNG